MNPLYEQLQSEEERKYMEAIRKFVDAVDAFRILTPEQKKRFYNDVCIVEMIRELTNR